MNEKKSLSFSFRGLLWILTGCLLAQCGVKAPPLAPEVEATPEPLLLAVPIKPWITYATPSPTPVFKPQSPFQNPLNRTEE